MSSNICIIPARMASSRFPGKPLETLLGLPLILHVYERCRLSSRLDRVVVATCDHEIADVVRNHGGEAVMCSNEHPGCVDCISESIDNLALNMADDDLVLMVQGDEILVTPDMLDAMLDAYEEGDAKVVNLASRIFSNEDHQDPNYVKVVFDDNGRALYFSRAPIPSRYRDEDAHAFQQTGIIGFNAAFLQEFRRMPRTTMEKVERVDMLRVIENNHAIRIITIDQETIGVDTPADLSRAESILDKDPIVSRYLDRPNS